MAVLLYFTLAFTIATSLTSCDKPQLDNDIPSEAVLFSEVIYTLGWAEVGVNESGHKIYTNGEDFITDRRADTSSRLVRPADIERPEEGHYLYCLSISGSLTKEQCVFYTPKELTSEYFVL